MPEWTKMKMPLDEAIKQIEELGRDAPQEALDTANEILSMNDGTCVLCGPYRLMRDGEYVHPFECEETERYDHNIAGLREYFKPLIE